MVSEFVTFSWNQDEVSFKFKQQLPGNDGGRLKLD